MQKKQIEKILNQAKKLAIEYRELTGKPLGITREIGEFTAAKLLNLELTKARQAGYDAIDDKREKIQTRSLNNIKGYRLGKLSSNQEWDSVMFVRLNREYDPISIHKAYRKEVIGELNRSGSKTRNERGLLGVRKFISISKEIWKLDSNEKN
ncbi:MAG: hypothetical protein RIE86_05045 [Imperialibacter sp.]|uniref:DUF6998 domain-containing protein n=1 Tax=Imperialibacter sp. TaxID=2038411 RepID=UPI0032EDB9B3